MGQEYDYQKADLKKKHGAGQLSDREYLEELCILARQFGYLQFVEK
ncbi:MAG: hypothetical protein KAX49_11500 [Halanaerobiales bacterium]|nr:hypothetical protein [Halanaerobiales bacterium]